MFDFEFDVRIGFDFFGEFEFLDLGLWECGGGVGGDGGFCVGGAFIGCFQGRVFWRRVLFFELVLGAVVGLRRSLSVMSQELVFLRVFC